MKPAQRDPYDRALRIIERFVVGLGLTSLTLAAVVLFTGWHLDTVAWGNGPAGVFPQTQAQRGERLYNVFCYHCHGGPDVAPRAAGVIVYPQPHNASGHTWQHPDCELAAIVRDGGDERTRAMRAAQVPAPALEMPAFRQRLSAEEIASVLAYIKTMWTPDERQTNEQLSRASCPAG